VEGRLPRGIGIERLRDPPTEWSAQFEALGLNPKQPQPRPAFPELLWRNARNTALDHRHRETDFLDAETKRCGLRRLDGGVGSQIRTGLKTKFPVIREFNREFCEFWSFLPKVDARNPFLAAGIPGQFPM
jgi:hypothetical protein